MSFLKKLKSDTFLHLRNSIGWSTNRKIVVFESDDWGSIRMPSIKAYHELEKAGVKLNSWGGGLFNKCDTLANEDDLTALFEVLQSVKDKNGNPAIFTAVSVVANPNFEKIRASNFEEYFSEPFLDTLEKNQGHQRTFHLWNEGMKNKLFMPQFHGREHLNVPVWMKALQAKDKDALKGFDYGIWGFDRQNADQVISFQEAYNFDDFSETEYHKTSIREGLILFEKIFGYRASFFVPPNGLIHPTVEAITKSLGITHLYASRKQFIPNGKGTTKKTYRYIGKENKYKQQYIIRNCNFEPAHENFDWVGTCLKAIDVAFRWKKPAILGPHRVSFIGGLDEKNRQRGLKNLKHLLMEIVKKYPDVEFMSTDMLGSLMNPNT